MEAQLTKIDIFTSREIIKLQRLYTTRKVSFLINIKDSYVSNNIIFNIMGMISPNKRIFFRNKAVKDITIKYTLFSTTVSKPLISFNRKILILLKGSAYLIVINNTDPTKVENSSKNIVDFFDNPTQDLVIKDIGIQMQPDAFLAKESKESNFCVSARRYTQGRKCFSESSNKVFINIKAYHFMPLISLTSILSFHITQIKLKFNGQIA